MVRRQLLVQDADAVSNLAAELASEFDHVDVVVNNAGTASRDPSEFELDGFNATIAVNLTGASHV